jgi:hypothetical protein
MAIGLLKSDGTGAAPGADDFAKGGLSAPNNMATNGNILSIVITIDKSLVTPMGSIMSVWASTNMAK